MPGCVDVTMLLGMEFPLKKPMLARPASLGMRAVELMPVLDMALCGMFSRPGARGLELGAGPPYCVVTGPAGGPPNGDVISDGGFTVSFLFLMHTTGTTESISMNTVSYMIKTEKQREPEMVRIPFVLLLLCITATRSATKSSAVEELHALCKQDRQCNDMLKRSYRGENPYVRRQHEMAVVGRSLPTMLSNGLTKIASDANSYVAATAMNEGMSVESASKMVTHMLKSSLASASAPCESNEYVRYDEVTKQSVCVCAEDKVCSVEAYSRSSESDSTVAVVLGVLCLIMLTAIALRQVASESETMRKIHEYLGSKVSLPRAVGHLLRT